MTAIIEKICERCEMEFDWPGVTVGDETYCCDTCARGEPCTCPMQEPTHQTEQPLSGEEAEQLGLTIEKP
jgi:hypothetical protein